MSGSAATELVAIAERDFRLVRDELTGVVYANPNDGDDPIVLANLENMLALSYYREHSKVAASGARRDAMAVLRAMDVQETVPIIKPAEPPAPEEIERKLDELGAECRDLIEETALLDRLDLELRNAGFRGDTLPAKLVFASCMSTLLEVGRSALVERLVSVKVDGPTAAGKNYAIDAALDFLPDGFAMHMSAMSERALIYDRAPLERRALYFPEGAALRDDGLGAIILRTLLSENRIRYPVVVTTEGAAPETVVVEREGPALALISTSAIRLDRDLETRLLRISIDDSEEQTAEIIEGHGLRAALGGREATHRPDWHAYYQWLRLQGPFRVRVPYGVELASMIPAGAVRLRRDVGLLFTLIATHAALNLPQRETDEAGHLLATVDDYAAVYPLVDAVLGQGVGSSVPAWARETYEALPLDSDANRGINYSRLGSALGIGPDAARDRALKLVELGHAINRETRRGAAAQLVQGDPIPEGEGFLPTPAALRALIDTPPAPGETNPNARNTRGTRMDRGLEVRVGEPKTQPETRNRAGSRVADRASGSPTRNPNAHEQRENGSVSGLRVDSGPPEREIDIDEIERLAAIAREMGLE